MKILNEKSSTLTKSLVLAGTLLISSVGFTAKYDDNNQLKDAWIDGKLETALMINRHLNNFTIDTEVKDQTAFLTGNVESEIDKELAEQIAAGINGVKEVENNLVVTDKVEKRKNQHNQDDGRNFSTWYDDATTTAAVKSKLLWNGSVAGLKVNVDTEYGVVTLSGKVESSAQKSLVEKLAQNTDGVRNVKNKLSVTQG